MPEKFRSSFEVINLEVNDDGDIIQLPVSDEKFTQKFYEFSDKVQAKANEFNTEFNRKGISNLEKINIDVEFHECLKTEFDLLFGAGSYNKVFGPDMLVGAEYVLEFIEACLPYIEEHTQKRIDKLSKYNSNRTGSSL